MTHGPIPLIAAEPPLPSAAIADDALDDIFTLQGVRAKQPRLNDGRFDWRWTGPNHDPEWAWFFNRHGWFPDLWRAWQTTADPRYREALLNTLADWISANPPPGRFTLSAAWRPLEAARRLLGSWLSLHAWIAEDAPPSLQADFEASLVDHGRHLRRHHAFGGNHLVTEMLALARLALAVSHNQEASDWLGYGLAHLDRAYREQVYPDGSYKELSSHYHRIITLDYHQLLVALRAAGDDELVAIWAPRVERLWIYMWEVTTPSGYNPLNNDSDRLLYANLPFKHAPALATLPNRPAHFPWAGQTVFRDEANHQWGFFDAGPRGTSHDHADHLSFTLSLGARDFLVDNGRHTYAPGPWRDYFAGPSSHNILLLDAQAADQGPRATSAAPAHPAFHEETDRTLAWGESVFALDGNPRAVDWRRTVIHLHGIGWIVLDHLVNFAPRCVSTQWHWHPRCTLPAVLDVNQGFAIQHEEVRLRIRLTTSTPNGLTECILGRKFPTPQGWFSGQFNQREPAPTLLHHQRISGPTVNAWVLQPEDTPELQVTFASNDCLHITAEGTQLFVFNHPKAR